MSSIQERAANTIARGDVVLTSASHDKMFFTVVGYFGDKFSVILDNKGASCTCAFGSAYKGKNDKECYHAIAARMYLKNHTVKLEKVK